MDIKEVYGLKLNMKLVYMSNNGVPPGLRTYRSLINIKALTPFIPL